MKRTLFITASMALILWSCHESDDVLGASSDDAMLKLSLETRAVVADDDTPIWIWANKSASSVYFSAWKLGANGEIASDNIKYWPSDGSGLTLYALKGNFEDGKITKDTTPWSGLSVTHTVLNDQTSDVSLSKSNLCYTSAAGNNGQTINMTLQPLLSKIIVGFNLSESKGITESQLSGATVTINDILPQTTFTSSNGMISAASGTVTHITICSSLPKPSPLSTYTSTNPFQVGGAIVPPQSITIGKKLVTVKLNDGSGRTFNYNFSGSSDLTMSGGYSYQFTFKIIDGELTVSSIGVTEYAKSTIEKNWNVYIPYQ